MSVFYHVTGEIEYGKFGKFTKVLEQYKAFRAKKGWSVPTVLSSLAGPMNTVRMIYEYPDLDTLRREEEQAAVAQDYVNIAKRLGFVHGSIDFEVYRVV